MLAVIGGLLVFGSPIVLVVAIARFFLVYARTIDRVDDEQIPEAVVHRSAPRAEAVRAFAYYRRHLVGVGIAFLSSVLPGLFIAFAMFFLGLLLLTI